MSGPWLMFIEHLLRLFTFEMTITAASCHVATREAGPRRFRGLAIRTRLLFPLVSLMPFAQAAPAPLGASVSLSGDTCLHLPAGCGQVAQP